MKNHQDIYKFYLVFSYEVHDLLVIDLQVTALNEVLHVRVAFLLLVYLRVEIVENPGL